MPARSPLPLHHMKCESEGRTMSPPPSLSRFVGRGSLPHHYRHSIATATPSHETQVRGVYQVTTTLPLAFREILDHEKALTYASFIRPPMHVEMQYKTGSDPPLVVFVCVQNGEGYPPLCLKREAFPLRLFTFSSVDYSFVLVEYNTKVSLYLNSPKLRPKPEPGRGLGFTVLSAPSRAQNFMSPTAFRPISPLLKPSAHARLLNYFFCVQSRLIFVWYPLT